MKEKPSIQTRHPTERTGPLTAEKSAATAADHMERVKDMLHEKGSHTVAAVRPADSGGVTTQKRLP